MKTCFKCSRSLPLEEFYRHEAMGDGHLNKCKRCCRIDARKNRENKVERYRAYDRDRYHADPGRRIAILAAGWDKRPERKRARIHLHNAVVRGKIVRPTVCQDCGHEGRVDAHHDDYAKPLQVRWLCKRCHGRTHRIEA